MKKIQCFIFKEYFNDVESKASSRPTLISFVCFEYDLQLVIFQNDGQV